MVGFMEPQLPLEQGEAHAPPVQPPGVYVTVVPDEDCPAKKERHAVSIWLSGRSIPLVWPLLPPVKLLQPANGWLAHMPNAACITL